MGIEAPPNIMKAGERPARVRTGAKTATKNQERDYLEKFRFLAQHPEVLVPEWVGGGSDPFARLRRKLQKVQKIRDSERRLRWASRGKKLWHAYAATLLVEKGGKIPSFASLKFQGRDVKFVYRTGAKRESLIGVQHYDDPEVRLLGYIPYARKKRIYLVSSADTFLAFRAPHPAPVAPLLEALEEAGLKMRESEGSVVCDHDANPYGLAFEVRDLAWKVRLCAACAKKLPRTLAAALDSRVLGPKAKVGVQRTPLGAPFQPRSAGSAEEIARLMEAAFRRAEAEAEEKYSSYSEGELLQWASDQLVRSLEAREGGFLLVDDQLWLGGYAKAAHELGATPLERRALEAAFAERAPRQRVGDAGLHRLLEPAWPEARRKILERLSDGLLRESELAELERLPPTEAISSLARLLAARERFKEILQFQSLDPRLEFVVDCVQMHRSGERNVLSTRLLNGAKADSTRVLSLSVARALGEGPLLEWQFAAHEKDSAAFLDPFVHEVISATPPQFAAKLARLAEALGAPPPVLHP